MLSNVIDIDECLTHAALEEEKAVAIFYDFAAAFPSVEHQMLFEYFVSLGWPSWLRNMILILYSNNFCTISLGSATYVGFLGLPGAFGKAVLFRHFSSRRSRNCYSGVYAGWYLAL